MLCFLAGLVVVIVLHHPWIYLAAGVLLGSATPALASRGTL